MFPKIWPASHSRWKVALHPRHSHFLSFRGFLEVQRDLEGWPSLEAKYQLHREIEVKVSSFTCCCLVMLIISSFPLLFPNLLFLPSPPSGEPLARLFLLHLSLLSWLFARWVTRTSFKLCVSWHPSRELETEGKELGTTDLGISPLLNMMRSLQFQRRSSTQFTCSSCSCGVKLFMCRFNLDASLQLIHLSPSASGDLVQSSWQPMMIMFMTVFPAIANPVTVAQIVEGISAIFTTLVLSATILSTITG